MKTRKIYYLALSAIMLLGVSCSSDEVIPTGGGEVPGQGVSLINKSGEVDGVNYSLKSVSINPDLVVITTENAKLTSTVQDLESGIIKLTSVSEGIASSLKAANVLYIQTENYTALRKVESVISATQGVYVLQTTQAQLGEIFQGGTIDLSVDLYEAAKISDEKNPGMRGGEFGKDYFHEIANITGKYNLGGIEYDPSTNIKMKLNLKMAFAKTQILPTEVETVFELQSAINPYLKFDGSINKIYSDEFSHLIPKQMLDLIKSQEITIDIPINVMGIKTLPAKVKITDILLPLRIEANMSKASNFTYNINGSFKLGFNVKFKGFKATATTIYENNIVAAIPTTANLNGELLTKADVVIIPSIALLDNSLKMVGDITLGVSTESNGNISIPNKPAAFGSKGVFTTKMNGVLDLYLVKVPIKIMDNETVLWSTGTLDKTITYSDLKTGVTNSYTNNTIFGFRAYDTKFTLNYKYPIAGKLIPNELLLTYEVYQKDGKGRMAEIKDLVIVPANVTKDSFTFMLKIPFKREGGIFSSTYQTVSYFKNIVIKDRNGYVYEGIFNTTKGVVENSIAINR